MNDLEDSTDLTDEQVQSAIPTSALEGLRDDLAAQVCPCGGSLVACRHAFRRRAPHVYWRAHLRCTRGGHEVVVVYRADWLRR